MAEISAKLVKELRESTGAGMMDCKKALLENNGDLEKSKEWLRQKGITSAEKKSGRVAAEGLVGSYIHTGGRVGVLVEINCETDFVARGETFQELVRSIAMQIAACPNVEYIKVSDIPVAIAEREKSIEMGRDDLSGKPESIKEKIVQGRIDKRLTEMCLMDQPYIRDQSITVDELVKQIVGKIGENIQVRRFARFVLGEGIEKVESNFADEVAQLSQATVAAAVSEPEPVADSASAAVEVAPESVVETTPDPVEVTPEPVVEAAPEPELEEPFVEAASEPVATAPEPAAATAPEPVAAPEESKSAPGKSIPKPTSKKKKK